jgi:hypothetical protein
MKKDNLVQHFQKAGLALKVLDKPIREVNNEVFQLDISRGFNGNKRTECFRLYKGHEDNLVQVLNADAGMKQLVLMVKEPQREFTQPIRVYGTEAKRLDALAASKNLPLATFLQQNPKQVQRIKLRIASITEIKRGLIINSIEKTPGSVRYYLCGVDERQLFIAQLPKHITTVAGAHKMLKGSEVEFFEGKARGKTIRQGEWFFVNATADEEESIKQGLKNKKIYILKKQNIGRLTGTRRGGKPHTAEEAILLSAAVLEHGYTAQGRMDVFVRGRISHADHKSVQLAQWRRVVRNNEAEPQASELGRNGVYWID